MVMKRRLIVALYIIFMLIIILPMLFQWNRAATEVFLSEVDKYVYSSIVYILEPSLVIAYIYFIYVTVASLNFYLKYKKFGASCYYFDKNRLHIHSSFSSIPIEKIAYMKIVRHVYRGERFVIYIKMKNKILKYKFRLGLGGFIRANNGILLKKLINDLEKRDISYEMK